MEVCCWQNAHMSMLCPKTAAIHTQLVTCFIASYAGSLFQPFHLIQVNAGIYTRQCSCQLAYLTTPLPSPHQGQSLILLHLSWMALNVAAFCILSSRGLHMRLHRCTPSYPGAGSSFWQADDKSLETNAWVTKLCKYEEVEQQI